MRGADGGEYNIRRSCHGGVGGEGVAHEGDRLAAKGWLARGTRASRYKVPWYVIYKSVFQV